MSSVTGRVVVLLFFFALSLRGAVKETPGPASRRTPLVISEIMYHPYSSLGRQLEYVEIFNSGLIAEDLGGFRISGDIDFTFPVGKSIPANGYLVVARVPADVQSQYGLSGVLGPYTNSLSSKGTIRLSNKLGALLQEVHYSNEQPWPAAADGAGHSLVLARPSMGEGNPQAWQASEEVGGSPGSFDPGQGVPSPVVLNEILARSPVGTVDFVELFNRSDRVADLSGLVLTEDPSVSKYVFPTGTRLGPGEFIVVDEFKLGFSLSAAGETIFLFAAGRSKVLDALRFPAQENGVTYGRFPDGGSRFDFLASRTPGAANTSWRPPPVVINEIMYHPVTEVSDDEYIELFNPGTQAVDVSGWRISGGIDLEIPSRTTIAPGGYLVLAKNAGRLKSIYSRLSDSNTVGDFKGTLSNSGERLVLSRPDEIPSSPGSSQTQKIWIPVNEVTYGTGGQWGQWSDGGGSSLELVDSRADTRLASNWADSDETSKAPWITIENTGILDLGNSGYAPSALHVIALGAGEWLVDDLDVHDTDTTPLSTGNGANLVPNANFELGQGTWVFQGNHNQSRVVDGLGFGGGKALRVVADGRGDTGANRIRVNLTTPLANGDNAMIRARVRWLRGHPELLLRLRGNWLEATNASFFPLPLGSPGERNSRAATNGPPVISETLHSPLLPGTGQAVAVSAKIDDPDGIKLVQLHYRLDPSGLPKTATMLDDGVAPDVRAGDGIYTGQIPPQATGSLVAFWIEAIDGATGTRPPAVGRYPAGAPDRECLVRFGDPQPSGKIGIYRIWMTQKNIDKWINREKLSNSGIDATFVYNKDRVVYNAGVYYSGSPFKQGGWNGPLGNFCDYVLHLPEDESFLGATDFVLALVGNNESDGTAQREQTIFWMAQELGIPANSRRFIRVYFNGNRRGSSVMEDAQQPNSELVNQWFPDDPDGDLHKIEDWFEFTDDSSDFSKTDATLEKFVTTGGYKKVARYRWNWRKRALKESANNHLDLLDLVDAMNTPASNYVSSVKRIVDTDEWTRVFALERIWGNWDSYGYERGKNMYAYKPVNGKWRLLLWDIDQSSDVNDDLFDSVNDPTILTFMATPEFRRSFWRAIYDAVNGPMVGARVDPMIDARYLAIKQNGGDVADPGSLKGYIRDRRAYLVEQLKSVDSRFTITSNDGSAFDSSTNLVDVTGTAQVSVKTIKVNGIAHPATWSSVTNWTIRVALQPGSNSLSFEGFDTKGNPVSGGRASITIRYTGPGADPKTSITINEIYYDRQNPGAGFIELFNRSTNMAFELGGYWIEGIDYTFEESAIVPPGGYLLLAGNRRQFEGMFGKAPVVYDAFSGRLDPDGEPLRIFAPAATVGGTPVLIDEVVYHASAPWPVLTPGVSLQLIDPAEDNNRVGNWAAHPAGQLTWKQVTVSGQAAAETALQMYLTSESELLIDDVSLTSDLPAAGGEKIQNGGFESPLPPAWHVSENHQFSVRETQFFHGGAASLRLRTSFVGTNQDSTFWQPLDHLAGPVTLSFWYLPNPNGSELVVRLGNGVLERREDVRNGLPATRTPGKANAGTRDLPSIPALWFNELQTLNAGEIKDSAGDADPWVEIYNGGSSRVDLSNLYLSDQYSDLKKWKFPAGAGIDPGKRVVVWLDGEAQEGSASEWHASFRSASASGALALSMDSAGGPVLLDYLNYQDLGVGQSYGSYPEGTATDRRRFYFATPGQTNDATMPSIRINEWMTDNKGAVTDPADGDSDDWFELYNPNDRAVSLGSFYLTDDPLDPKKFKIPGSAQIPAHGFLVVWADGETGQNAGGGALHASFKLSTGETIQLSSPDGMVLSTVTLDPLASNQSAGSFPDGAPAPFTLLSKPTPGAPNVKEVASSIRILSIGVSNGSLQLSWVSVSGAHYAVESKAKLTDSTWTRSSAVTATGSTTSWNEPFSLQNASKIYRIVEVP